MPAPPEFLRTVGLFASLPENEIDRLAGLLKKSTFSAGTVILAEGKGGIAFFLIGDGIVEYSVNGERVGSGSAGDYFGEIALIDDTPRGATVTAATDVIVYGMTFLEFGAFLEAHPEIAAGLRTAMTKRQGPEG